MSFGEIGGEVLGLAGEFLECFTGAGALRWQRKHFDLGAIWQRVGWVKDHHAVLNSPAKRHGLIIIPSKSECEPKHIME